MAMAKINLNSSAATFPLTEMIACGLWAALSPGARAVLGVVWDHHRRHPDACHPAQGTLALASGVSKPTVARAIVELEKVGLVKVIPAAGPGPNTYRLNWTDLALPGDKPATVPGKPSPYHRPNAGFAQFLEHAEKGEDDAADDADDKEDKPTYQRNHYGHRLPDGCVVHTAREVGVHAWLVAAGIPHWCQVPYSALDIRGLHEKSSVDFVVGPRLVVEVFGLPQTQKQASAYTEKRRRKEKAVEAAGWVLLAVEPDKHPDGRFVQAILNHWALATVQQARDLHDLLVGAGLWHSNNSSCQRMTECLSDARNRAAHTLPARRRPSGAGQGWTPGAGVVDLLLDEAAGTLSAADVDDLLDDTNSGGYQSEEHAPALHHAKARVKAIDEEIAALPLSFEGVPYTGPDYASRRGRVRALQAEREKLVKESGLEW